MEQERNLKVIRPEKLIYEDFNALELGVDLSQFGVKNLKIVKTGSLPMDVKAPFKWQHRQTLKQLSLKRIPMNEVISILGHFEKIETLKIYFTEDALHVG